MSFKSFNMFSHCRSFVKHGYSASVSVTRVIWVCKGDMNLVSGENCKEPLSSTISTEAWINSDSNEETLNVNKNCWQQ